MLLDKKAPEPNCKFPSEGGPLAGPIIGYCNCPDGWHVEERTAHSGGGYFVCEPYPETLRKLHGSESRGWLTPISQSR